MKIIYADAEKQIKLYSDGTTNISKKQVKELQLQLKTSQYEEEYLKQCCIKAGKELGKHSFEWDGKEKNLVVQAMQLNEQYENLQQVINQITELCKDCRDKGKFTVSVYKIENLLAGISENNI